jgi:hypothetical protein
MVLTEKNFTLIAIKNYDMKRAVSIEEFKDDIKRFQYLKRLLKRYDENGELKTRLILNHLIVLYNCFGPVTTPMLFMKLKDYHKYLKPFVVFLNFTPERIMYEDVVIINSEIPLDENIVRELRKI